MHPQEKSATLTSTRSTRKSGSRDREKLSAVDQLFELAAVNMPNMDYGSYYGHSNSHKDDNHNGLTSHHLFGNHYSAPPELFHDHHEDHTPQTGEDETYETYHSQYHTSNASDKGNGNGQHRLTVEYDHDYELNPTTPTMDVSALSSLPEYDEDEEELDMNMAWE